MHLFENIRHSFSRASLQFDLFLFLNWNSTPAAKSPFDLLVGQEALSHDAADFFEVLKDLLTRV